MTLGVAACEPGAGGGLNATSAALTTDQLATRALEHGGVGMQWMSCTAQAGERSGPAGASATAHSGRPARNVAAVDCEGETTGGKKVTVKGKVTEEHDGRCVRGDLRATVAGSTVFQANVLGNCNAAPPSAPSATSSASVPPPKPSPPKPPAPTHTYTHTGQPSPPRPTVTRTVRPPSTPPTTPPVTVTVTSSSHPPPDPPPPCRCETPNQRNAEANGTNGS